MQRTRWYARQSASGKSSCVRFQTCGTASVRLRERTCGCAYLTVLNIDVRDVPDRELGVQVQVSRNGGERTGTVEARHAVPARRPSLDGTTGNGAEMPRY